MISNFLFHRVSPERDALWDPMDLQLFEKCVQYISKHFEVHQLEEFMQQETNLGLTKKIATIEFDDGYKDNIQYAAPILEAYKVKASFYVVTDCIERNIPTWTHVLDYSFQFTHKHGVDLSYDFLPPELRGKKFEDRNERIAYAKKLKPALKKVTHQQRLEVLKNVTQSFDDVVIPPFMMNWSDLQQLKNAGHYIGSHTVTHPMLGTMIEEDEITEEIFNSAKMIEERLGYLPITISYPVGSYNDTTIAASKKAGYKLGLAVKQRRFNPEFDNHFEIPRIELYNESWLKTRLRIDSIIETANKILRR